MAKQKPLFIYDCDGTLQGLTSYAWAMAKKHGLTNLSLAEFKSLHQNDKALFPGVEELIKFTATQGDNILISDGCPLEEGCQQLFNLRDQGYFKTWKYKGKEVEWGSTPNRIGKTDRSVASELLNNFLPSHIVVIGDTLDDYVLALHLSYFVQKLPLPDETFKKPQVVAFLKKGVAEESCHNAPVPVFSVSSAYEMQNILKSLLKESNPKNTPSLLGANQDHAQHMLSEKYELSR